MSSSIGHSEIALNNMRGNLTTIFIYEDQEKPD